MELIFVFTHLVMVTCLAGVLYVSITSNNLADERISKKSHAAKRSGMNLKPARLFTSAFYRIAANHFIALTKMTS